MTMPQKTITLDRFLVERQQEFPDASGRFTRFMTQIGTIGKIIANQMRHAALNDLTGTTGETNIQGESVKPLDLIGNQAFIEALEYVDIVGMLISEEMDEPKSLDSKSTGLGYAVMVDPIDGSTNIDVNGIIGSIFSVHDIDNATSYSKDDALTRIGRDQVAAGYIMYGPSTMLVYTANDGVHSFVLNNEIGEFILHKTNIQMPEKGTVFSANLGYYSTWKQTTRDYSDYYMQDNEYSLRYSGALLADFHQILHQGGVFYYPSTPKNPQGKLRLLYECAPLALIAEQAGGIASNGDIAILDIQPTDIHQRTPFIVGSKSEVNHFHEMQKQK
ncbi:MAG: class 1 fructose-bisphosphatase [Phototrophicaceae bacterium]